MMKDGVLSAQASKQACDMREREKEGLTSYFLTYPSQARLLFPFLLLFLSRYPRIQSACFVMHSLGALLVAGVLCVCWSVVCGFCGSVAQHFLSLSLLLFHNLHTRLYFGFKSEKRERVARAKPRIAKDFGRIFLDETSILYLLFCFADWCLVITSRLDFLVLEIPVLDEYLDLENAEELKGLNALGLWK
jgi:hypothetical protein